jgi:hypothetical protein
MPPIMKLAAIGFSHSLAALAAGKLIGLFE